MCRVAKHCLPCSVAAVVTAFARLPKSENQSSDLHDYESRQRHSILPTAGVYHFKYDLHQFVISQDATLFDEQESI